MLACVINACACDTASGLTAWAANVRSVNSFYESDSEPYKNSTVPSLQAQKQLLLMQYDIWASVYQFTQVKACTVLRCMPLLSLQLRQLRPDHALHNA